MKVKKIAVKLVRCGGFKRLPRRSFLPVNDGIDHINIYSQGRTEIGRLLSNWSYRDVTVAYDGHFKTVEGYIYWLLTNHKDREQLRETNGFQSKARGRAMRDECPSKISEDNLKRKVKKAILSKVYKHTDLQKLLLESTLPFDHYYVYGKKRESTGRITGTGL